jgi:3-oxoacyl-[acyl-carrier-protein] synthase II
MAARTTLNRSVAVVGMGLVSALGVGVEQTWQALLAGKTGIGWRHGELGAWVPNVAATPVPWVEVWLKLAVEEAITDAGLDPGVRSGMGVVVGSSRGYQAAWESGAAVPQTLPGLLSHRVARWVGSQGRVAAVMAACATANWAIAEAAAMVGHGEVPVAIAAVSDAAITPLSRAGFRRLGVLARTGCFPFSQVREGLVLGEGAGALILMAADRVPRDRPVYGLVAGWGMTNDATHPTHLPPDGVAAQHALERCLEHSGLSTAHITHVLTHGTGTYQNDRHEAMVLSSLFGDRLPHLSATKGATGHALAATGMMEAIFCLLTLKRQILPPCVGLERPEFDLPWVLPGSSRRPGAIAHSLNLCFGFGGQNTAVAFHHAQEHGA